MQSLSIRRHPTFATLSWNVFIRKSARLPHSNRRNPLGGAMMQTWKRRDGKKLHFYTFSCHTYTIKKKKKNTGIYCITHGTRLSVMCQPGWEWGLGKNGCMYMCGWVSPHCSPETIITLLISYTLIQNKKFKVWGKNKTVDGLQGAWVRSQVRELRTCMPLGAAKNKTKPLEHVTVSWHLTRFLTLFWLWGSQSKLNHVEGRRQHFLTVNHWTELLKYNF